jgi:hypothetical protein
MPQRSSILRKVLFALCFLFTGFVLFAQAAHTTHNWEWVVNKTTYPATSIETCTVGKETRGAARPTRIGDTGPGGGRIFFIADGVGVYNNTLICWGIISFVWKIVGQV